MCNQINDVWVGDVWVDDVWVWVWVDDVWVLQSLVRFGFCCSGKMLCGERERDCVCGCVCVTERERERSHHNHGPPSQLVAIGLFESSSSHLL